jgi:rubrerythrin
MKKGNTGLHFVLITVIAFAMTIAIPALSSAGDSKVSKTLENLQVAFNGESNAHAKYLAYSEKAGEEGYHKVAALFRAAAYAEEIHLNNHAKVIKGMGASPKAEIKLPVINSTAENLADAIKGETYEQTVMYPAFLDQAEIDQNAGAVETFSFAKDAEAQHAMLYKKALNNLDSWKVADAGFGVCPTCGYTVEGIPTFKACPVCGKPASDYKIIT